MTRFLRIMVVLLLLPLRTWADGAAPWSDASIAFLYGDREIYPSALICFTDDAACAPSDDPALQLGDKKGALSLRIRAPADLVPVQVTFAATPFFEESTVNVILPQSGKIYFVAPKLRLKIEKLAAQKQPLANLVLHATVEGAGSRASLDTKIVVHSVNDCLLWYRPRPDANDANAPALKAVPSNFEVKSMIAAYVNENNPWMDQRITRHALDRQYVPGFYGYQGDAAAVTKEIGAIYDTLADFGFKYVNFAQPSAAPVGADELVRTQSIRLVGDAMESSQANGLETAAIMASVLHKMSLQTIIFIIPTNPTTTLLGVYTEQKRAPKSLVAIDVRSLGYGPFSEALSKGKSILELNRSKLLFGPDDDAAREQAEARQYRSIDIDQARRDGVLPIPEVLREFPSFASSNLPADSNFVPMNTQKKLVGAGVLSTAVVPAVFGQISLGGMNSGGPAKSYTLYWVIGGVVAVVVIIWLMRRRKGP